MLGGIACVGGVIHQPTNPQTHKPNNTPKYTPRCRRCRCRCFLQTRPRQVQPGGPVAGVGAGRLQQHGAGAIIGMVYVCVCVFFVVLG